MKKLIKRKKPAGIRSKSYFEVPQRLNAGDLTKPTAANINSLYSINRPLNQNYLNLLLYLNNNTCSFSKGIPYFSLPSSNITGLSDGESSFVITLPNTKAKNSRYKKGFIIGNFCSLQLHIRDYILLNKVKTYFNAGKISIRKGKYEGAAILSVQSIKELISVIKPLPPYGLGLYKYTLLTQTQKNEDFHLFKSAFLLINQGGFCTCDKINKLIAIKASMNKGLTDNMINIFPYIVPITRPSVKNSYPTLPSTLPTLHTNPALWKGRVGREGFRVGVIESEWLAGFFEAAESSLLCLVSTNAKHKVGYQTQLIFTLTQHRRDLDLMLKIKEYLGCGPTKIYDYNLKNISVVRLVIKKFSDNSNIIIPFFKKYPLYGLKNKIFEYYCEI